MSTCAITFPFWLNQKHDDQDVSQLSRGKCELHRETRNDNVEAGSLLEECCDKSQWIQLLGLVPLFPACLK